MSLWSRWMNVFRGDALNREIHEEFEAHIAEAMAEGRTADEARRTFGPTLRTLEESRDFRLLPWLDALRGDMVFAWRQLKKNKITSAAAILSIGLAIGACTAAFWLVDALLLRPLAVDHPERLFVLSWELARGPDGKPLSNDGCNYPMFRQMRASVKGQAELIAVGYTSRVDLEYAGEERTEKAYEQYVSGWMFSSFGLKAAVGRVFTEGDDITPGAHPYAVLSYDYWNRRFGLDPHVLGRTFRTGNEIYQIVGVADKPFTGTETGTVTDIFIPTMMMKNHAIERSDYQWFRTFVKLKPGASITDVRNKLRADYNVFRAEVIKRMRGMSRQFINYYLSQQLVLEPAAAGVSGMQKDYGRSLIVLSTLVALVLLIACANVANLLTANAAARSREMALRVSIGAGRWRLIQMVLVESALLSFAAAATGVLFAWWSAPLVVGMINPPDNPARLLLPADARILAFSLALAAAVTMALGLPAAFRASAVRPAAALKGGEDPHSRRRLMHSLIALQAAFCVLVLFVGGLLMVTFQRLADQPTGFNSDGLLTLETLTPQPVPAIFWEQVAERLRSLPGVRSVALSEWPLLTGESWNGLVSVRGRPSNPVFSYFLSTTLGWRSTMQIPLLSGRDFLPGDKLPGSAIVNSAFAKLYFGRENPVGQSFDVVSNEGPRIHYQVVGEMGNARYRDMREPMPPVAYFPFQAHYGRATFIVRVSGGDPMALAPLLRREISHARTDFEVSSIRTQKELNQSHTVRERMLAMLASFFAAVALLLAGLGLYGVLDYSVLQRRREIGIRMALGAQSAEIATGVTARIFALVLAGAVAGLTLGLGSLRLFESLLYQVKATDAFMLALPTVAILIAALLAALPAVIRATRIDPAVTLRAE